jgi:hypothetical protein
MASREVSLPTDAILIYSLPPASPFGRQGDGDNAHLKIQRDAINFLFSTSYLSRVVNARTEVSLDH